MDPTNPDTIKALLARLLPEGMPPAANEDKERTEPKGGAA